VGCCEGCGVGGTQNNDTLTGGGAVAVAPVFMQRKNPDIKVSPDTVAFISSTFAKIAFVILLLETVEFVTVEFATLLLVIVELFIVELVTVELVTVELVVVELIIVELATVLLVRLEFVTVLLEAVEFVSVEFVTVLLLFIEQFEHVVLFTFESFE
jgi:hypothetical protein